MWCYNNKLSRFYMKTVSRKFTMGVERNNSWKYIFTLTTLKRRHTNAAINLTPLSLSAMNFYGCLQSQSFNKGITFWIWDSRHLSGDTSPSPGCNTPPPPTSFLLPLVACMLGDFIPTDQLTKLLGTLNKLSAALAEHRTHQNWNTVSSPLAADIRHYKLAFHVEWWQVMITLCCSSESCT